ncbi:MAG TPA: hypothetical protein VGE38_07045 [Nocardioides sp.]|uniref:hypothetical protein n=1 Tax=Nocardioides sp. TaxID=35761 RepID=UPI002ED8FA73
MTPDDPRHGTPRGYSVHREDGEQPCAACKRAVAKYEQERQLDLLSGRGPRLVDSTGSIRRLRALAAIGWPWPALDLMPCGQVWQLTRRDTIRRDTAERIAEVYDRLSMTPGPSIRAVRRAAANGWAPPLAWNDIDNDPAPCLPTGARHDVDEVVVVRILAGDASPARSANPAERRAVVAAWLDRGRSLQDLERLTGWRAHRYLDNNQGDTAA